MVKKLLIFFSVFFLICCRPSQQAHLPGEGVVKYDINYHRNELKTIPANFLPKTMTYTFNGRYTKNSIEGFMGIISITNVTDLKKDTATTILKFLDYKYYYTSNPKEAPCCYEIMEKPKIRFYDDTIRLAGILCHKAYLTFKDSINNHHVLYSREIGIKNPNKNTGYQGIDGVLMDFMMELNSLTMHYTARNVKFSKVEDSEFTIPSGYIPISRNKMVEIINGLLE